MATLSLILTKTLSQIHVTVFCRFRGSDIQPRIGTWTHGFKWWKPSKDWTCITKDVFTLFFIVYFLRQIAHFKKQFLLRTLFVVRKNFSVLSFLNFCTVFFREIFFSILSCNFFCAFETFIFSVQNPLKPSPWVKTQLTTQQS